MTNYNLPSGWKWGIVGDVSQAVRGVTFSSQEAAPEHFEKSIACLTTSGVQEYVNWDSRRFIPLESVKSKAQVLAVGDILVSTANSKDLVGKACSVELIPFESTFGAFVTVIRPQQEKVVPKYLGAVFRTTWAKEYFYRASSETTNISNLRTGDLLNLSIPLPPLDEQRRIAAILEEADHARRIRRYAQELSDSFLQEIFVEMFGDLSKFSQVTLESLANNSRYALSSGPFGSNLTSEHYVDSGVVVLRGTNISNRSLDLTQLKYVTEEKAQELARSEVRPGDIVVVAVGSSGLSCLIDETLQRAIMSQNFNKITPDVNKINPIFLVHAMNSLYVQNQLNREITDTVRTFLSLTKLKDVTIPLPARLQQDRFAEFVVNYAYINTQQRESARQAEHLFQTLLNRAFTGEL